MGKPGWTQLVLALPIAGMGFYCALTTKPGEKRRGSVKYTLMEYARSSGWIFAIGGSVLVLRILFILLSGR